jgi:hypothetical protein
MPGIPGGARVTYTIPVGSPKRATAASFGRELVKACETRGIPRNELWRATGIGRTALDNYRTGSILPRTEAAAALAQVLEWPKLLEIVRQARTRTCVRCTRPFRMEGGNSGRKIYCGPSCRELAAQEKIASRRLRVGGQTDDRRQTQAAIARLRSGIRIAEGKSVELADAIDAMCNDCEPQGVCRTADCPLRSFSPLPFRVHETGDVRTMAEIRVEIDRKAGPKRSIAMTRRHAEGLISYIPKGDRRHPANDPERREAFIEKIRVGRAANPKPKRSLTPEHRAAIAAGHARRRAAAVPA